MRGALLPQQNLFGLYELDQTGTVLDSQLEPAGPAHGTVLNLAGHNFFKEVVPFTNADELRCRVNAFSDSPGQIDNFTFTCECPDGPLPVRVVLARIRERAHDGHTKAILLHIRKV